MFGQNKHDCLKICNQQYIFLYFYTMAAAPPDVCRCYDCELGYDDLESLFVHNKEAHFDVGTNLVFCLVKVDPQSIELSTSAGQ